VQLSILSNARRGLVERALVERALVERALVERALVERALVSAIRIYDWSHRCQTKACRKLKQMPRLKHVSKQAQYTTLYSIHFSLLNTLLSTQYTSLY
jgi:hypothetical protein